jgi:hypothetical protein
LKKFELRSLQCCKFQALAPCDVWKEIYTESHVIDVLVAVNSRRVAAAFHAQVPRDGESFTLKELDRMISYVMGTPAAVARFNLLSGRSLFDVIFPV